MCLAPLGAHLAARDVCPARCVRELLRARLGDELAADQVTGEPRPRGGMSSFRSPRGGSNTEEAEEAGVEVAGGSARPASGPRDPCWTRRSTSKPMRDARRPAGVRGLRSRAEARLKLQRRIVDFIRNSVPPLALQAAHALGHGAGGSAPLVSQTARCGGRFLSDTDAQ